MKIINLIKKLFKKKDLMELYKYPRIYFPNGLTEHNKKRREMTYEI